MSELELALDTLQRISLTNNEWIHFYYADGVWQASINTELHGRIEAKPDTQLLPTLISLIRAYSDKDTTS